MDCEKFDQHVMDALYDELDELTHAAMKRHMESCSRCASAFAGLRATRDVGILPLEEPSEDLEARILDAVAVAQKKTPWRRKALRALAWAGSHAMRPQLAMAALFVLVIGSSLLLLRAKPGTVGVAPVRVTERGVPAPEQPESPSPQPVATEPPQTVALATAAPAAAPAEPAAEAKAEAPKEKAAAERSEAAKPDGASAALKEAQALKSASGCGAALAKLDQVGAQYPGTAAAHTAMWEAAQCYKAAGDEAKARELLLALRSVDTYKAQAEQELADESTLNQQMQNSAPAGGAKAGAAAPARAAAARPAPAPPPANADQRPAAPNAAPAGQGLAAPMKRSADAAY
jgi:hypothetical protein